MQVIDDCHLAVYLDYSLENVDLILEKLMTSTLLYSYLYSCTFSVYLSVISHYKIDEKLVEK